jgi:hypothetical protein
LAQELDLLLLGEIVVVEDAFRAWVAFGYKVCKFCQSLCWANAYTYRYLLRQKLHVQVRVAKSQEDVSQLELPGWDRFVELMRSLMDAPHLAASGLLPAKDLAFKALSAVPRVEADRRIAQELASTNRGRQFLISTNKYLGSLSVHFKDSADDFAQVLAST